jgi:hypothetical protein
MHQPGGHQRRPADIAIQAEVFGKMKRRIAEITARQTGQTAERITADADRDRWFVTGCRSPRGDETSFRSWTAGGLRATAQFGEWKRPHDAVTLLLEDRDVAKLGAELLFAAFVVGVPAGMTFQQAQPVRLAGPNTATRACPPRRPADAEGRRPARPLSTALSRLRRVIQGTE